MVAGVYIAANAVLRTEKCHEFHVGSFVQNVNIRLQEVVNARRIGYETYALAFKLLEIVGLEHLDSGFDFLCRYG